MTTELIEVVTTVSTEEEAATIASTVVGEGLAACAHVEGIRSVYRWKGEIRDDPEFRVTLKTVAERGEELEARLRRIHPYETPMILRLPVPRANDDYVDWARRCTSGRKEEKE